MLLFVATDEEALGRLQEETRRYLAWRSIVEDADALNLDRTQRQQAERARDQGEKTITSLLDSAYSWLLVPNQEGTNPIVWEAMSLAGGGLDTAGRNFVERASNKSTSNELLIPAWSPVHLIRELDTYLWRDGRPHIKVKDVWEALSTYVYFPRLKNHGVLLDSIKDGVRSKDFFGYALAADNGGSYRGLVFGESMPSVYYDDSSVLVRSEVASAALEKEPTAAPGGTQSATKGDGSSTGTTPADPTTAPVKQATPTRFYGRVRLNPQRLAGSAGQVSEEVLQHLSGLVGADVEVELEIGVRVPEGIPDQVVRTVTENARTLKFENHSFESE